MMNGLLAPGDKVVLATVGIQAEVLPFLMLGQALRARGMDVMVVTSDLFQREVLSRGLRFALLSPSAEQGREDLGGPLTKMVGRALEQLTGAHFALKRLMLPYVERNVAELQSACTDAKLLLAHPYVFAAPMVADLTGVAWRTVFLNPRPMLAPYDMGIVSPLMPLNFLRPVLGRAVYGRMRRLLRAWTEPLARPLEELRRGLGLGPSSGHPLLEGAISPQGSFALFDPILLDGARKLPPRLEVAGFPGEALESALRSDLLAFLDRHPHPLVFSFGVDGGVITGRLYELASQASEALRMPAVFLCGDYEFKRRLPPDQLRVSSSSPRLLFPRAAAIVHRGTISTCFHAVRGAAPQLILPMGFDQPDNAQRLQRLGVALTLHPLFATKQRLTTRLRRLLVDKNFPAAAVRITVRMLQRDGAQRVAELLTSIHQADAASVLHQRAPFAGHVDVVV